MFGYIYFFFFGCFLVIKLGAYQIRSHRLQTKSHQWIWVSCVAVIESQASIKRVRCNYRVISTESVKKFKEAITLVKTKSTEVLLPFSTGKKNNRNDQLVLLMEKND